MTRTASSVLLFVAATGVLMLAVVRTAWPWIADDAFISLRYSENLLHGHGLVWNPGERVEGYSNLLWVLLSAGLGLLGCDLVTAVRVLAMTTTAATLAVLTFSRLLPPVLPARLALVLLAAQGAVALWAIGGLEAPLAMLLVASTMLGIERGFAADAAPQRRWLVFAGVQLALLAWTRPDGPLWSAVAAATVWCCARRARPWPLLLALLTPPVLAVLAQLGFRLAYYGDWIPNTGHAKATPIALSLEGGYHYLLSAGLSLRSLLLPAAIGAVLGWRMPRARPLLLFATIGCVGWCLYVLRVGGDVFPRNRFLVIAFAPLCVLAANGIAALAALGRAGKVVAWAVALASLGLAAYDAERPTTDVRQQLSPWEWQAAAIGAWLGQSFAAQQPLVAVDAAGGVPFFSRLPSLDMMGLCDATIARTPVATDRVFIVGHNRGNGAYVLARRPDVVLFTIPGIDPIPRWKSGVEMIADPSFFADYRLVQCETGMQELGGGTRANVPVVPWLRLEGRIGVQREAARVIVPGYLLGSFRQSYPLHSAAEGFAWLQDGAVVGVWDASSARVVGEVRRPGRHVLSGLQLAAGTWTAHADGAPAGVSFAVTFPSPDMADLAVEVPDRVPLPFRLATVVLQRSE